MRYEKVEQVLQLALEMQAAHMGLSLQDIEQRFGVSHRTAQRMRDAVCRVFTGADEVPTGERTKRWRIPKGTLDRLIGLTADEISDMEVATKILKQQNMNEQAASLVGLLAKLKALQKPDAMRRLEPDIEALLEAEQLAMRPGPRPKSRPFVLEELRNAIKGFRKVNIAYRNRSTRRINRRVVHPYGFLYGHRHYLVAFNTVRGAEGYRLFSLPNIEGIEVLDEYFERDPEFSLQEFSQQSFGVFQEEPFDVVWRFSPKAAADAADFSFHPNQESEKQSDGSLIVSFRSGGALEMCWHLYCWGEDVEVLAPAHLAAMCATHREEWPGLP